MTSAVVLVMNTLLNIDGNSTFQPPTGFWIKEMQEHANAWHEIQIFSIDSAHCQPVSLEA